MPETISMRVRKKCVKSTNIDITKQLELTGDMSLQL